MRTLTIKKGGGGNFHSGWNTATVQRAEYGVYNGSKFIDVWFDGYPESLNMRIYETRNKDGEEFAVGQLFRFANAGIVEGLEGPDGNMVVKLSDEPENLNGCTLNIYLYKDGDYFRILKQTAPTVFNNAVDTFNEDDIMFWQKKAEAYYHKYVLKSDNGVAERETMTAEIPF
jgi:hypothetical protein